MQSLSFYPRPRSWPHEATQQIQHAPLDMQVLVFSCSKQTPSLRSWELHPVDLQLLQCMLLTAGILSFG